MCGNFHRSQKITEFFSQNRHLEGFWHFVHGYGLASMYWKEGEDFDPQQLIENGFTLAQRAAGTPVYVYFTENDDKVTEAFYFIGTEEKIMAHLEDSLRSWLADNPQDTPEQKQRLKLKRMREEAESALRYAQYQLKMVETAEDRLSSGVL